MSRTSRVVISVVYGILGIVLAVGSTVPDMDTGYRVICAAGLVSVVFSLRSILGTVVKVSEDGLVVQRYWPVRRSMPWYRIELVDVLPGFWNLEVQLNSGERIELPPVAELDDLYQLIEHHRTHLDA